MGLRNYHGGYPGGDHSPGTITAAILRPATVHLAALILQAVSNMLNSTKGEMVFFLCATLSTLTVLLPAAVTLGTAIIVLATAITAAALGDLITAG